MCFRFKVRGFGGFVGLRAFYLMLFCQFRVWVQGSGDLKCFIGPLELQARQGRQKPYNPV